MLEHGGTAKRCIFENNMLFYIGDVFLQNNLNKHVPQETKFSKKIHLKQRLMDGPKMIPEVAPGYPVAYYLSYNHANSQGAGAADQLPISTALYIAKEIGTPVWDTEQHCTGSH